MTDIVRTRVWLMFLFMGPIGKKPDARKNVKIIRKILYEI